MENASLTLQKRYSFADYLTFIDDKRREIIDGFIKMMSSPKPIHQKVSSKLVSKFIAFIEKYNGDCEVYPDIDVRLPINGEKENGDIYNVVRPDISIICDKTKIDDIGCLGAPDMIVEIQSFSTSKYDLNEKFYLYERVGVKEYWVVYPNEKGIEIFLLQSNGKYDSGTRYDSGKVPVSIFNNCLIEIEKIF